MSPEPSERLQISPDNSEQSKVKTLVLFFTLLPSIPAHAAEEGQLRLYRWNPGLRAEREPALETAVSGSELQALLQSPSAFVAAHPEDLFHGCYLAAFTPASKDRAPASTGAKTVFHRICTAPKKAE